MRIAAKVLRGVKPAELRMRGFTLIELLVVVAIICLLAAILFPVFARARESARRVSCLSNAKQIGLALEQYKQDYDGKFPFSRNLLVSPSNWYNSYLKPYIKSEQVVRCPNAPSNWLVGYSFNMSFGYFPGAQISPSRAGKTENFCGTGPVPVYDGMMESIVREPSSKIVLTESTITYYCLTLKYSLSEASARDQMVAFGGKTTRASMLDSYYRPEAEAHFDGVNNVYADGHAKWQKLSNLMVPEIWCP